MTALYDTIGLDYANLRRADPRIAAAIHAELPARGSLVNVGAGTGSYEPTHLAVTAVEPSAEMIRQRSRGAAPAVQATAEALPFADDWFDVALAVLKVHHWTDPAAGLREMCRVARGPVVILTFDTANRSFWLFDYLPELAELDRGQMPTQDAFEAALGPVRRVPVPVPRDCIDGFLCAYWRRPAAYLDPRLRRAMSSFWKVGDVTERLARLEADLHSGAWEARYGHFLTRESWDFGYHLLVAEGQSG